jgi:LmbE family N-acetylglucosaminyl deacetylase
MQLANLDLGSIESPSILCLGAHCDDIEIGCGATLASIAGMHPSARFDWVVFCGSDDRNDESRRAAQDILSGSPNVTLHFFDFRDGYLPYSGAEAKDALRRLAATLQPDLVFTHHRDDAHQDHRLVSEITANEFRNQPLLEYEIPKFDGDLGKPNVYFPLSEQEITRKTKALMQHFPSQADKHWFTEETFRSLARLRGIEAGATCPYAEAFYCRKLVVGVR